MSEFVNDWHVVRGEGLYINGERFPYHVDGRGAMVEPLEFDDLHIFWLPLIAKGPAPRLGPPDGEPVDPTTATTDQHRETEESA